MNLPKEMLPPLTRPCNKGYSCGQAPLMLESRYPELMEKWKSVLLEEKIACSRVRKEMVGDFGNLDWSPDEKDVFEKWFNDVLEYHAEGHYNWLVPTVFFIKMMKGDTITPEELHSARILVNFMNISTLNLFLTDDYIDSDSTRNGRQCWYFHRGAITIIDCIRLTAVEFMLAHYYSSRIPNYEMIFKAISRGYMEVCLGEELDISSETESLPNTDESGVKWDKFTLKQWETLAYYKTSFLMRLVLLVPFYFCGISDQRTLAEVTDIANLTGELIQATNDWMDWALWDHSNIANNVDVGRDIRKGRLTWSSVTAWTKANDVKKRELKKYYGVDSSDAVDKVIHLYEGIGVPEMHHRNDVTITQKLLNLFDSWDSERTGVPGDMFPVILTVLFSYYNEDKRSFVKCK